jgi:putative ABC transport system ATP-binding protein/macrolide transport system ATP-binding/permease protein/lipoprotein-releasing system ATP-binding protein
VLQAGAILALAFSAILGLVGAFLPAWRVRRMAPYALLQPRAGDVTLSARSLTKRYGGTPGYEAVRDASLDLRAGEFVSIVGRSGSGKSTLMAMLGALTEPTEGKVLLDGTDLWTLPEAELAAFRSRHIGFVFQVPSLLPNLTAVDNVALPALLGRTMPPGRPTRCCWRSGPHWLPSPGSISGGGAAGCDRPRVINRRRCCRRRTDQRPTRYQADIITSTMAAARILGFVLVTHNRARQAGARPWMRQGACPTNLPQVAAERAPATFRSAGGGTLRRRRRPSPGANLWRSVRAFLLAGGDLGAVLLTNFGIEKCQRMPFASTRPGALRFWRSLPARADRSPASRQALRTDDLSAERRRDDLRHVMTCAPMSVRRPGRKCREVDEGANGVLKVEGKHTYRYQFDARVRDFAQLLPNYMHVRFAGTMLVSPSSTPKDDVFERKDNYYVYLKPFDVTDEAVARRMRFSGKPPGVDPMLSALVWRIDVPTSIAASPS